MRQDVYRTFRIGSGLLMVIAILSVVLIWIYQSAHCFDVYFGATVAGCSSLGLNLGLIKRLKRESANSSLHKITTGYLWIAVVLTVLVVAISTTWSSPQLPVVASDIIWSILVAYYCATWFHTSTIIEKLWLDYQLSGGCC